MCTFGPGPLCSDTALDLLVRLEQAADPQARAALLTAALHRLAATGPDASYWDDTTEDTRHQGIAACAVVVAKLAGEYLYGYAPHGPGDFALEMLPDVDRPLLEAAVQAAAVAQALHGHPALGQWRDATTAEQHRAILHQLASRVTYHLRTYDTTDNVIAHDVEREDQRTVQPRRITTQQELAALADELCIGNWHEPDENAVTATVHGLSLGTAGHWPLEDATRYTAPGLVAQLPLHGLPDQAAQPTPPHAEMYVTLHQHGQPLAHVNLSHLLAWAVGCGDDATVHGHFTGAVAPGSLIGAAAPDSRPPSPQQPTARPRQLPAGHNG